MATVQITAKIIQVGKTLMVHMSTSTGLVKTLPPEPWLIEFFGLTEELALACEWVINETWVPSVRFEATDGRNLTRKLVAPR
jgi:hypothetical protein